MTIREIGADDLDTIAGLIREANRDVALRFGLTSANCPKHPSFCTTDWVKTDVERGIRYFIIEQNDEAVGCVAYETPEASLAYLNRLSVAPAHRRCGHGTRLVRHIVSLARSGAITTISIGVIGGYRELVSWYEKRGFVVGETRRFPHLPFPVTYMSCTVDTETEATKQSISL